MVYKRIPAEDLSRISKVLNHYDLDPKKCNVTQNTLANVNKVFLIKVYSKKYILRESSLATPFSHLQLEAKILEFLAKKKFRLTPHLIPNIKGDFFTLLNGRHCSLQGFLPGEVRESVSNLVRFNNAKLVNFFKTSAQFTKAIQGFKADISSDNKPLYSYVKNGNEILRSLERKTPSSSVKRLLSENKKFLNTFIKDVYREMKLYKYNKQPKQIVHFDLHPGNVNYLGDKVSGLFDFDWARWDCRLTDLACTVGQSCYAYQGKNRAKYDAEKIRLGLKAYRAAYGKSEFDHATENKLLRVAFRGYMLYQLFWIIEWYLTNLDKPEEALKYVSFSIDVLKLNNFDGLIKNNNRSEKTC